MRTARALACLAVVLMLGACTPDLGARDDPEHVTVATAGLAGDRDGGVAADSVAVPGVVGIFATEAAELMDAEGVAAVFRDHVTGERVDPGELEGLVVGRTEPRAGEPRPPGLAVDVYVWDPDDR